ncbi:NADH-cytochrome b5 reductase [Micractinium conductrix]|uniref:cytochrome-b5 reductase n=1 Tax=Micractinium conductrix TaxID=554055 RepID=A0A2P6VDJ2_9CHLO|nr:NADH-cytochrome b5 reductase [Micractinium conductrix]|eukprot:PSC72155.1 NADH-cytochrome b5 reductase [Micractinium conductrix]
MFSRLLSRGSLLAVGTAAAAGAAAYAWTPLGVAEAKAVAPALSPEEWRPFKLVHKEALTHGANPTVLFRFALPDAGQEVGLPVASCLLTRAPIGSEKPDGSRAWVIRPYTPISHPDEKGHFDLAIKVYHQPAPGKMSSHIDHLKVGGSLDLKGPLPKMSLADIAKHKRVGMLAGGSGLTPCLQVAEEALRQKLPIELSFIFANVSERDIIAKDRLDALAKQHPNFKVHYIVDKAESTNWKGSTGYITKELLKEQMPPPAEGSLILVCGPPPMMKAISGDKLPDKSQGLLSGMLKDMGYTESMVYKF